MFKVILLGIVLLTATTNESSKTEIELTALTKFFDQLGQNSSKVENAKFRWDWHLTLCKEQLRLDKVLNQRNMIELNGKYGYVRCPISQFWPGDNV